MIGALVVLLVIVLGWVAVRAVLAPQRTTPVKTVDYSRVVPAAREAADFDLLAPPTLPAGWRATTVGFTSGARAHWHLGVLTDHGRYVGLEQGRGSVASMVDQYVDPDARKGAPVQAAGRSWSTYTDAGGDLALVERRAGTTTLVVGHDIDRDTLVSYVESLR